MGEKVIITRKDDKIFASTFEENELVQLYAERTDSESILGNIYLGKVKNIVKNINAAFIEIENGVMCYLSISDNENPLFTNVKKSASINIGDTLVVQISKEDIKTKAPYATSNFCFTGKYIALTHGKNKIGVSAKITSDNERIRLKGILNTYKNDSYGLVARTNCEGVSKEAIEKEILLFTSLYENILTFGIHKSRFSCIYRAPKGYICNIRDGISEKLTEIITDEAFIFQEIKEYLNCYQPEDTVKLRFYEDKGVSLSSLYGLEAKLQKALQKKVWLNSGGSLVIEPTEALTVIDVNTGKAIKGKRNVQNTFFKLNQEAAIEIAKQIRLRNLSGIILIDFIDMESKENQEYLLNMLSKLLKSDPVKTILVDMTSLGLVEITRKKVRKPLHEQLKNSIL